METYQEKCDTLIGWAEIDDRENRLFFAARNGAIAKIMLDIERFFAQRKIFATAQWKESSHKYLTRIEISIPVKAKSGDYEYYRTCWIKRDVAFRSGAPSDSINLRKLLANNKCGNQNQ